MLSSGAPSVNYSGCAFAVALRCMPWTHGIWHYDRSHSGWSNNELCFAVRMRFAVYCHTSRGLDACVRFAAGWKDRTAVNRTSRTSWPSLLICSRLVTDHFVGYQADCYLVGFFRSKVVLLTAGAGRLAGACSGKACGTGDLGTGGEGHIARLSGLAWAAVAAGLAWAAVAAGLLPKKSGLPLRP